MVDFRSEVKKEQENEAVIAHNTRKALFLFAVYTAIYAGFMLLSAFAPQRMSEPVLGGVNLAVVYGFALIAAAIVLALVYVKVCRKA